MGRPHFLYLALLFLSPFRRLVKYRRTGRVDASLANSYSLRLTTGSTAKEATQ